MQPVQRLGVYVMAGAGVLLAACSNPHFVTVAPGIFGSLSVKLNAFMGIWSGGLLLVVGYFPQRSKQ